MSNSPLVDYIKISPNKTSPRNRKIDTITIHCVVGQCSVETLGNIFFPPSRRASCQYGIGPDGRIGMYCEEKDCSWCSSSSANDNRAITIECASDTTHPYAINDTVYKALIELCVDICKRNGIKELKWQGNKALIGQVDKQNLTVHRWFANKACPGDYIYERLGNIANEVNAKLNSGNIQKPVEPDTLYRVQTGAFSNIKNAKTLMSKVKRAGFDTYMIKTNNLYKIQVGAFSKKVNAEFTAKQLKQKGFDTYITTSGGEPVSNSSKKSVDEIAREVIQGLWGNGADRKNRLTKAGHDYTAVQKRVSQIL